MKRVGEGKMKIQKSAEDYLETILMLIGMVRSIDIVNETGYSKPSISIAMKRLRENGFIYMDANGYITLADTGLKIAKQMYERHQLLTAFLIALGVNETKALTDACKIEHDISDESYQCIKKHLENHLNSL